MQFNANVANVFKAFCPLDTKHPRLLYYGAGRSSELSQRTLKEQFVKRAITEMHYGILSNVFQFIHFMNIKAVTLCVII